MEETSAMENDEDKTKRKLLLRDKKGRSAFRESNASASSSCSGSGIYDTINDIDIEISDGETTDDITIIDHDNPESEKVLKWMRTSLRQIRSRSSSLAIEPDAVSFTESTSTEYSESGDSTTSAESSGKESNNLSKHLKSFLRRKKAPPPSRQISCRHENSVTTLNCTKCNRIVCDKCMQSDHFGHEIEDMSTAVKRLTIKTQKYLELLSGATKTFQENIETVIATENHIQKGYEEMEYIINSTAETMTMRINEDRDNLLEAIKTHRENKLAQTTSIKRALNSTLSQLTDKFSDSYESFRLGAESGEIELVDVIQGKINPDENRDMIWAKQCALKNPIIKDHDVNIDVSDVVKDVHDVSYNSIGELVFEELLPIPIHYPCNLRLHNTNFDKIMMDAKMYRFHPRKTVLFPLNIKINRIFIVRGNFWLPRKEGNKIDVYSPKGELKTTLELLLIQGPKTILQSTPNEVLVGHSHKDSGGLTALHIPLHGDLIVKSTTNVMTGRVTEISMEATTLVTLSATEGIVTVTEVNRDTNIWTNTAVFQVPHKSKTAMDTILVNNALIYVCGWGDDMVSVFNLSGQLLKEYSYWNKLSTIGKRLNFCNFRVCMVDSKNSLLLSDRENDNFQILSVDGKWRSFKLPSMSHPLDIVALGEKELWVVLGGERNTLKQYVLEQE